MRKKDAQGITFGVMDAVITVMGVMLGLSVIGEKNVLLTGMFVTGFADSFANASGMYAMEGTKKNRETQPAYYCFAATLGVTVLLSLPVLAFSFDVSPYLSVTIGMLLLVFLGYYASKFSNVSPYRLAVNYLVIGVIVSIVSYIIGSVIILWS